MQFCPNCANLLVVEPNQQNSLRFSCPTCAYVKYINGQLRQEVPLIRKKVDDVLGTEESMKTAETTNLAQCPRCGHNEAYHFEMQTRSADEPATHFYKCVKCKKNWRE
ncbi:MAG: DNA-directed RNA polymerase III subunit RPC11 [Streblomastix strix]|uniref:DNA-directed RNA polymerase subunit n=1 Tax=Streblomastix strix TaxID=222440 RepID=A0A5J4VH94_9EUKA|nr:MAG: DNA-directed RNA polymerase III subunit RPC11 [Streblomastix strix]